MSEKKLYPRFLIKLPWWFDLILAGGVYYIFKYWIPTVHLQSYNLNRFIHSLPQFAELFALILVVNAILSAYHSRRK